MEPICPVCSNASVHQCLQCMKVSYCSIEHKKDHRNEHKLFCYPVKIVVNDDASKNLEATRDIQKGEHIFIEKPLLTGPKVTDYQNKFPLCLECYKIVRGNYRCTGCKWPLCGRACEMGKKHSTFECRIFSSHEIQPIDECEIFHYVSICVLRGLLLKTVDPDKWEQFVELDSKQEQRRKQDESTYDLAVAFIQKTCRQTQFDANEIDFVGGIVQINRMSAEFNESSLDVPYGSYIYHKASFASQSCIPNAMWFIQKNDDLILRSSIDIKKGELVTTSSVNLEDGTFTRRANLKKHYIDCKCQRCLDVTELGTYMSAVKCQNPDCRTDDGYYLMVNPLDEYSVWSCNDCGHRKTSSDVEGILAKIEAEYNAMESAWSAKSNLEGFLEHIKHLEFFLNKHEGKTLHKRHSILYRCKSKLGYIIPIVGLHIEDEQERQILEIKHVLHVNSCLEVANIFWPGLSRYRGQLLYALQRGLFCVVFSEAENLARMQANSNEIYIRQVVLALQKVFKCVLEMRKEVKAILEIESEGKVEKEFATEMETEGVDFIALRRLIDVPA